MIITYKQLIEVLGGSSAADLVVRLNKAGIVHTLGKYNQPFTTETAINAAMGLSQQLPMINPVSDMQKTHIEIEV